MQGFNHQIIRQRVSLHYSIPLPAKYKNNPIAILKIIINSTDDAISIPKLPKSNFAKADNTAVDNNVYKKSS